MRKNLKATSLVAFVGSLGISCASGSVPSIGECEVSGADVNQIHQKIARQEQAMDQAASKQSGSPAGQSSKMTVTDRRETKERADKEVTRRQPTDQAPYTGEDFSKRYTDGAFPRRYKSHNPPKDKNVVYHKPQDPIDSQDHGNYSTKIKPCPSHNKSNRKN